MSVELFGRHVTLQIGQEGEEGRSYSDLRIAFSIDHTRDSTPSRAVIEAYNLAAETVALLQDPDVVVRLVAGYDLPRSLFRGNPVRNGIRSTRTAPNPVVSIEAQDGLRRYQAARVNVSFARETTLRQVYDAVAEQLGLPDGVIRVDEDIRFPHGITLAGTAREVLDRIAETSAADWWIRDGVVQLVPEGGETGEQAIVFSAETGNLIGSPVPTDNGIEVTALLDASMRPGRPFVVESEHYEGTYIADTVSFRGDSGFDTPFYVICTGRPR